LFKQHITTFPRFRFIYFTAFKKTRKTELFRYSKAPKSKSSRLFSPSTICLTTSANFGVSSASVPPLTVTQTIPFFFLNDLHGYTLPILKWSCIQSIRAKMGWDSIRHRQCYSARGGGSPRIPTQIAHQDHHFYSSGHSTTRPFLSFTQKSSSVIV